MGLSNIKTIGLFNVVNFAKRNLFMHLCSVCFPTTYHLCYCELWISMGSRHREETNPCLLIQEKTGNQPREGSDPGCSVFQITEDTKLRRQRNIWTPGYSNTPLKDNLQWDQRGHARVPACLFPLCDYGPSPFPLCGSHFSEAHTPPRPTSQRHACSLLEFLSLPSHGHWRAFYHIFLLRFHLKSARFRLTRRLGSTRCPVSG